MKAGRASVSHEKRVVEELRVDPEYAREFLKAALEEEGPAVVQIALRQLAIACGMANVARAAGVSREALYRALSERGNPTLKTVSAVAEVMGLRVTLVHEKPARKTVRKKGGERAAARAA